VGKLARRLVKSKQAHRLLPLDLWPEYDDAQRFLSLCTAKSKENLFPYDGSAKPTVLKKIKNPCLVVLAEKDEYRDRPIKQIAVWFQKNSGNPKSETIIVSKSLHSLQGQEGPVVSQIRKWISLI